MLDAPAANANESLMTGQRGLKTLRDTQRLLNDTERLGEGIMGQLHDQRGQLEESIDRRQEMSEDINRAAGLIRRMSRRAVIMKVLLSLIILLLVGAIGVIVYLKWFKPSQDSGDAPSPPTRMLAQLDAGDGADALGGFWGAGRQLQAGEPTLGAGVIVLIGFGFAMLLACLFASAMKPGPRIVITVGSGLLYTALALFLFLMPKQAVVVVVDEEPKITDSSRLGRYIFFGIVGFCTLLGGLMGLISHAMVPYKSPRLQDDELPPTFVVASAKA